MRFVRKPTRAERNELERMTRQEVGRVAMRAHMALLSARGYPVPQLEAIHNTSKVTIYKWFDRFDEHGPPGLYDEPRSGRPPKVDEPVKTALKEALDDAPTSQGYNFTVWTVALLRSHLQKKLGVCVCADTIRRTLHQLGFRWRRPRWVVAWEDPQAVERMRAIAQAIWKADSQTIALVSDETKFKALPPLRSMWMRQGQQARVPTPQQNPSFYSYGALDIERGTWFDHLFEKANSDTTIAYLKALLEAFPHKQVLLIWDQARYHTALKVENWIEQQKRLRVLLLPKYSPHLNPIEHIWRVVKQRIAANLTRALDALQAAYQAFFGEQNAQSLLQTAGLLA